MSKGNTVVTFFNLKWLRLGFLLGFGAFFPVWG